MKSQLSSSQYFVIWGKHLTSQRLKVKVLVA